MKKFIDSVNPKQLPILIAATTKKNRMRGAKSFLAARFGLGFALAALLTPSAYAEAMSGDAQIAVVTPLSFIQVDDLHFGSIIASNTAGTVTITTASVRSATNGIIVTGTGHQAARFAGMGTQNQRVRIRITPNSITLTGPGPAMTVDNFITGPAPTLQQIGASPNYRILPANGIFWFTVGARLSVGASQPAGTYSGTFSATLEYQ